MSNNKLTYRKRLIRQIVIALLLNGLFMFTACSASYRSTHGKGMVPCPCEKQKHHR